MLLNQNAGYASANLTYGSNGENYLDFLRKERENWQRVWESEVGTTIQNDYETVTKNYIVDYLSVANRDIMVVEDGSWVARFVYDAKGFRISAEFSYADGTERGDGGENFASDFAVNDIQKVWYRSNYLGSSIIAVDVDGAVISHTIYDPWGNPLTATYPDANYSGIDGRSNFTGYSWDEVLGLYYAQARMYDPALRRILSVDPHWHPGNMICGDNPTYALTYLTTSSQSDIFNPKGLKANGSEQY